METASGDGSVGGCCDSLPNLADPPLPMENKAVATKVVLDGSESPTREKDHLERRLRAAEVSLESVVRQVQGLVSVADKVVHTSTENQERCTTLQDIVAVLQGRISALEEVSRKSHEEFQANLATVEENQTMLAQEVASGALTDNTVAKFFTQAIRQNQASNAMEQKTMMNCIQDLTQALRTESLRREEDMAKLRQDIFPGKSAWPPSRVSTGTVKSAASQALHSRLSEIDTDMKALKSHLAMASSPPIHAADEDYSGHSTPLGTRPSRLHQDGGRCGRFGSGYLHQEHSLARSNSRGDVLHGDGRLSPSPSFSRAATTVSTRAHSPDREGGGPQIRAVPTPWSHFVPFAQHKLTVAGTPAPAAALNQPGLAPQLAQSSSMTALRTHYMQPSSPVSPRPELVSPTRLSAGRPLQEQRVMTQTI